MEKCGECGGLGYRIGKGGAFARAQVCICVENCGECGGRGFTVRRGKDGYRYKSQCGKCAAVHSNVAKYNRARVPSVMASASVKVSINATTGNSKIRGSVSASHYVDRFINSYPKEKGFVLAGSPGQEKTSLAAATVAELTLKQGIDCLFQDFNDLMLAVRGRSEGVSESDILEPLFKTELLVMDNVGLGGRELTGWERSVLENLVSRRYGAARKLILTTKYKRNDLESEMGDQGFSKLAAMCKFLSLD